MARITNIKSSFNRQLFSNNSDYNEASEIKFLQTPKLPILNYFRALIDFGFVSFMIPYRLAWSSLDGYKCYENKIHKALCIFFQSLVVYEVIIWSYLMHKHQVTSKLSKESNLFYVPIAHSIKCGLLCIIYIITFWVRKLNFFDIIIKVQKLSFTGAGTSSRVERKTFLMSYGIFTFGLLWSLLEICGFFINPAGNYMEGYNRFSWRGRQLTREARVLYLFKTDQFILNYTSYDLQQQSKLIEEFFFIDYIITGLHYFAIFPHYICRNTTDKCILLLAILGRSLVVEFVNYTKGGVGKIGIDEILFQYEQLKVIIRAINDSMGFLILCFVGACLPLYPTWSGLIFSSTESTTLFEYLHFGTYFGIFFLILAVGADMNSKMGEFYQWISSKELETTSKEAISPSKMTALMMDMYSDQIALRGAGFFKMNYSFFGTVLGVIVTYTVIIIQNSDSKTMNESTN